MDGSRRRSRLPPSLQLELLKLFVAGVPARAAAELTGVNRNTAILFFHKLREVICARLTEETPFLDGEIKVHESYFGRPTQGQTMQRSHRKSAGLRAAQARRQVHAVMITDANSMTLMGIMRQRIRLDSVVYTDSFDSYDILDVSKFHHHRNNHSEVFARERNHINGIENFWNHTKRRLAAYNGIPKAHFHLFLNRVRMALQPSPGQQSLEHPQKLGQSIKSPFIYVSPFQNVLHEGGRGGFSRWSKL